MGLDAWFADARTLCLLQRRIRQLEYCVEARSPQGHDLDYQDLSSIRSMLNVYGMSATERNEYLGLLAREEKIRARHGIFDFIDFYVDFLDVWTTIRGLTMNDPAGIRS